MGLNQSSRWPGVGFENFECIERHLGDDKSYASKFYRLVLCKDEDTIGQHQISAIAFANLALRWVLRRFAFSRSRNGKVTMCTRRGQNASVNNNDWVYPVWPSSIVEKSACKNADDRQTHVYVFAFLLGVCENHGAVDRRIAMS
jgi:hypothetical protein